MRAKVKIKINGETPRYTVINSDGTYAGVFCITYEEACNLAAQQDGRVIMELRELKAKS